jgi:hypothetical protein
MLKEYFGAHHDMLKDDGSAFYAPDLQIVVFYFFEISEFYWER